MSRSRTRKGAIIVLDLMGVIMEEGMYVTKILYPLIQRRIEYQEFKKRYTLYAVGNIGHAEFWEGVIAPSARARFEKRFLSRFRLMRGCRTGLKTLSKYGDLVLFSEVPARWGNAIITQNDLRRYFRNILFSGKEGHTKPYRAFFSALRKRIGKKGEVLYIDDTMLNIAAAKRYHFKTVLFRKGNVQASPVLNIARSWDDVLWIVPNLLQHSHSHEKR